MCLKLLLRSLRTLVLSYALIPDIIRNLRRLQVWNFIFEGGRNEKKESWPRLLPRVKGKQDQNVTC